MSGTEPDERRKNIADLWRKVSIVYSLYFQPNEDMSKMVRFFWAWLGSLTLYMPLFTFEPDFRNALSETTPSDFWSIPSDLWIAINSNLLMTVTILLCLFSSLAIGGMIAASNNRYGPVRLYLSGLMLSSFTLIVVASAYVFWPRDSASIPDAETLKQLQSAAEKVIPLIPELEKLPERVEELEKLAERVKGSSLF